ncbi:hypothetical protein [Thermogutta sp.]|uniref:phage major capsid protein n=1 Tax=Thermogutta sp. TaxID=1962930 RepID=UPI00322001F6
MSVNNFIPELWSRRILETLQKTSVYTSVCNRDYEGEIKGQGDRVRITALGPVTVSDYTKNSTTITPETLNDEQLTLEISQAKYFAFQVDDVDRAQAGVDIMAAAMNDAAYRLRDAADQYIASLYTEAGSISSSVAINSQNALAGLLTLAQALDERNVPTEGRWCIIPPWYKTKLVLAKVLVENTTNEAFDNGFVGRAAGFDLKVSNNVPAATGTYRIMAGIPRAITYAEQINKVEAYRLQSRFADAVRGLHLYGAKVVLPDALAVLTCTIASEP